MPHPLFKDYSDTESTAADNPEVEEEGDGTTSELTKAASSTPDATSYSMIRWGGGNKKTPIVHFSAQVLLLGLPQEHRTQAEKYHLSYKFVKTECKLVRSILNSHCFREVHPNSSNFNLMWTGSHLKPHTLRGMQDFQKINHFPRSYELTRKDRLYKNIQRMQHSKGFKHFDFIPNSFVLPEEYNEFHSAFTKDRGPWIVKPVASSRGRGIFLISHPSQIPLDDHLLVCKYIPNPLLIDGFKFDIRLYIGVTSYDPLRIYLFEEGLSRFATVKYDQAGKNIRNTCMHLTNYSVNKKSENFISCQDPEVEDYGNKWSMGAMLRYLKAKGMDTTALMMRIEDVIVKTIIAGELPIASACKMFMPSSGNCFEIYGFDILLDEKLRPWLLEVNLSPSLACDSPLDLKIKSHLMTDMFNLIGFVAHDPLVRRPSSAHRVPDYSARNRNQKQRAQSAGAVPTSSLRPTSAAARRKAVDEALTLTPEESRILRQTKDEYARRGGFVRIFPTSESWELYGSFLEHRTTHNHMLHSKLFPGRKSSHQTRPSTASLSSATARAKNLTMYKSSTAVNAITPDQSQLTLTGPDELSISLRISCYERKLDSWTASIMRPSRVDSRPSSSVGTPSQTPSLRPSNDTLVYHPSLPSSQHQPTRPNHSISSRSKPEGEAEKPVTDDPVPITRDEKPPLTRAQPEATKPVISVARAQSARDASRPPRPQVSQETVSKRVLSAQPRFKAVRVDDIMEKSASLTKLQARQAFAMYLQRVQQRLIQEASYDSDDSTDSSRQDEQMSLVIRFLKKAACNLQQPFKVVIPSRKLPLHDRRRILAKQLGDFVHVYGKETAQVQRRHDINSAYGLLRTADSTSEIPDEEFKVFMAIASETELEDILTRYTKLNKNASVFLGGDRPERTSDVEDRSAVHIETGLQRRRDGENDKHTKTFSTSLAEKSWSRPPREDLSTTTSPSAVVERHARAVTAVSAYGTSVAINKTRQRPVSARPASQASDSRSGRTRPFSAKASRDQVAGDDSDEYASRDRLLSRIHQKARVLSAPARRQSAADVDGNIEPKGRQFADEHAVATALQRLAKRQSARNYSAMSTSTVNGHNWSDLFQQMDFSKVDADSVQPTDDGFVSLVSQSRDTHVPNHVTSKSRSHDRHASANATFNSFVGYRSSAAGRNDGHVNDHVTDPFDTETAVHKHAGSHPSQWKSIRVDLPKEHDDKVDNELKNPSEQKKSISREEYNKHIRLLSQKLSEEKLKSHGGQTQPACMPRPPPGPSPSKKAINAKRIARLASSNPHMAFDFVTGSSTTDSYAGLDGYA